MDHFELRSLSLQRPLFFCHPGTRPVHQLFAGSDRALRSLLEVSEM